jgi:hypothetical protein
MEDCRPVMTPRWRARRATSPVGALFAAALAVVLPALAGCGGDDGDEGDSGLPLVAEIDGAVAAIEAELGGGVEFFEVTASPNDVRLFVAVDDASVAAGYTFIGGELTALGEPEPAEGFTFSSDDIDFDPDLVLDTVTEEVPDAAIGTFSVIGTEAGPVRYGVFADSAKGGTLDITLEGDGTVLGVGPAS